jgi:glycosyltransferase involved in cell wall biosynthesis
MKPAPPLTPTDSHPPKVSVIIPARNEEANLGRCLRSVLAQQGIAFQVIVVDDHSADRTAFIARQIIQEFSVTDVAAPNLDGGPYLPAVGKCGKSASVDKYGTGTPKPPAIVIEARRPLPAGWTGKANALCTALPHAQTEWLLFTDADTEHAPGSLAAAVQEAERHRADLFSLSPEQEVSGFWERALMPVVFSELATTFRPQDVSDPAKPIAAANGQYLLIRRAVYEAVGGHAAVAADLLEDVALARRVKAAGHALRFRLGEGMVRTRMYRGLPQMREGWTKNLALLFPDADALACRRLAEFAALIALPPVTAAAWRNRILPSGKISPSGKNNRALRYGLLAASAAVWGNFLRRTRKAHFDPLSTALAFCGLPLFARLLARSARAHRDGQVQWKGRNYCISPASAKIEGHAPTKSSVEPTR